MNITQVVKLHLTLSLCFYTNVRIFTSLNKKKNELKKFELRWIMGKQKKFSDKNQCFDWMQSIQSYQLINND